MILRPLHLDHRIFPDRDAAVKRPPFGLKLADDPAWEITQASGTVPATVKRQVLAMNRAVTARYGDAVQFSNQKPELGHKLLVILGVAHVGD